MAQLKATVFCSVLVAALLGWCGAARATMIEFATPSGSSVGSGNVDAQADFTISPSQGQVAITLTNLEVNPKDVGQNVSGLTFVLSTGDSSYSLVSGTGTDRTVNSNGTFTEGSTGPANWGLSSGASGLDLTMLGTSEAPHHTIIGPPAVSGTYSASNSSINNGNHSPFLDGSATFTLSVPSITAGTTISDVVFVFGTDGAGTVNGTQVTPEPATMAFLLMGLPALARRRRAA